MEDRGSRSSILYRRSSTILKFGLLVVAFFHQLVDNARVDERSGIRRGRFGRAFLDRLQRRANRVNLRARDSVSPSLVLIVRVLGFVAGAAEVFHHDIDSLLLLFEVELGRFRRRPHQAYHVVAIALQVGHRNYFAILLPGNSQPGKGAPTWPVLPLRSSIFLMPLCAMIL